MTPQKAQMTQTDRRDAAIDLVAKSMVAVADDPDLAVRIVSALPERSSRFGWLLPQFAALGALVFAVALWTMREQPATPAVLPSTAIAAVSVPPVVFAREPSTEPRTVVRTRPSEPSELPEPLRVDFERALPALEVAGALELDAIGPAALPAAEALTLAPLEIGELPLTAETVSPNKL